jgi:exopolysaccharide biosynthesis polyprenyl glycosylphosphotransferase
LSQSTVHAHAVRGDITSPRPKRDAPAPGSVPEPHPAKTAIRHRGPEWRNEYATRAAITDAIVLALATAVATIWRFGFEPIKSAGHYSTTYLLISAIIAASWWLALTLYGTREPKIVGEGVDEYRRIVRATFVTFGCVAIVSLLIKSDLSRAYLAVAFPLGLIGLLFGRKLRRKWLAKERQSGRRTSNVLVIGGSRTAKHITATIDRSGTSGYRVTGVWVPDRLETLNEWLDIPGRFVPVLGTSRTLADALVISDADTVIVSDTEHLGHDGLKSLAWELEGADIDLMVSPNVIDVAGPRIHLRAVANMPLLHLEEPRYAAASRWGKVVFDKSLAALVLLVFSPLAVAVMVSIKLTSPGPVLYRSTRVGVRGETFDMLKFRTMDVGAEQRRPELSSSNDGAGPLFKMRDDPRVTTVGRLLRRYSIDELPQLVNVLKGEMSMVGPRPPLPSEVEAYEGNIAKRLLVRQGITGLWQVSGRSDLTWEESVRLDLDYVENWSMVRDLQIIWRTIRAVMQKKGAY